MRKALTNDRFIVAAALLAMFGACGTAVADVWNVSDVPGLNAALGGMGDGDEIVLGPGTYNLTRVVAMNTPNVTIRGASGDRDDVILVGGGMNTHGVDEGITIGANNVHVYNLTLKDFFYNALHLRAESDITGAVISNVKTWNVGERHIKGSWDGNVNHTSDNALIEKVYMLQTEPRLDTNPSGADYIGGMDIMSTNNIVIRDCVAEGIRGYTGGGNAAIFLWQGHNNFTIERNVIIGTNKGIGIGLTYYARPNCSGGWHADGGVIRNNTVLRNDGDDGNNIGLELCGLKNVDVYHNTVYSADETYFRNLSFWDDGTIPISNLQVQNNIFRGGVFDIAGGDWSAAAVAAMGNIVDEDGMVVVPEWFTHAAGGDFHLTDLAAGAIDTAEPLTGVADDMDRELRPFGVFPDYGADEYVPEPAGLALLAVGGLALLARRKRGGRRVCLLLLAVGALVGGTAPARADYVDRVRSLDPVAYWRFNDPSSAEGAVAADSSAAGTHSGLYHNGVVLTTSDLPGPGSGGSAATFDGVDDYIGNIPDAGFPVDDEDRTFTGWVKYQPPHPGGYGAIFTYGTFTSAQMWAVLLCSAHDVNMPQGALGVSQWGSSVGTDPVLDGNWHFLAVTCSASHYRVYLDGQFVREKTMTTNTILGPEIRISHPGAAPGQQVPLEGWLDEIAVFDTVLTDESIRDLYVTMPEPAGLALLAIGGLALLARRKRGARRVFLLALLACGIGAGLPGAARAQELGGHSYVPLSGQPHDVIYDPGRGLAYVSNRNRTEIDVVRLSDGGVLAPIPLQYRGYGMTLTADGAELLVTFWNDSKIGVVDLASGQQTGTIDTPAASPLRIDRDCRGRIFWRTGVSGGPYGSMYELDPGTGVSTAVFTEPEFQPYLRYSYSQDRRNWVLMIDSPKAALWDAMTDAASPVVWPDGFGYGHWAWISQGAINNYADTILLTKSGDETRVFDGSFNFLGSFGVGTAWGTFGPWHDLALIVEAGGGESPSNRVSLLDTQGLQILDTLALPEAVGMAEFNFGARPIELTPDAGTLLAVGQSGLFIVDTSAVPEPCCALLLAAGACAVRRRKRRVL